MSVSDDPNHDIVADFLLYFVEDVDVWLSGINMVLVIRDIHGLEGTHNECCANVLPSRDVGVIECGRNRRGRRATTSCTSRILTELYTTTNQSCCRYTHAESLIGIAGGEEKLEKGKSELFFTRKDHTTDED
jgi:hypothetical protein